MLTTKSGCSRLIPESARPPLSKQGVVRIEFVIGKDGKVEARPDIYGHDQRLKAALGLR